MTKYRGTKRPLNVCKSCGYSFYPRGNDLSSKCPQCGSTEISIDYTGAIMGLLIVAGGLVALILIIGFNMYKDKGSDTGVGKRGDRGTGTDISPIADFTYLRTQTYSCNGQTHTVKEYRHNKTELEFVLVPEGTYMINGKQVKLSSYLISKTEVTQGIWRKIMGTTPWSDKSDVKEGSDYPATYVFWQDCQDFCKKVGLRLPREVEWEVACRAGTMTTYYWGNDMDGNYAWYEKNAWDIGEKYAHRVAQKKPNAFGLYDMTGNVWEWVEERYDSNYLSGTDNPKGPSSNPDQVSRGGGFASWAGGCASAYRSRNQPDYRTFSLGFRVVCSQR